MGNKTASHSVKLCGLTAICLIILLFFSPGCYLLPGSFIPMDDELMDEEKPIENPPAAESNPQPAVAPPNPVTNFSEGRNYYGPICGEEGDAENAPYRWSVEVLIDPVNNLYEGTIQFHDCPAGGRAVYRVSGSKSGNLVTLTGDFVAGGGKLFQSAPLQQTFTLDISANTITPNMAP